MRESRERPVVSGSGMAEPSYRSPAGPTGCTACGAHVDPMRLVYNKSGDLVCSGCEGAADGVVRLRRGAAGAAYAACAFGYFGTIALLFLLASVLGGSRRDTMTHGDYTYYRGTAWKLDLQVTTGWVLLLCLVIGLAIATIAGAHRTLGAPSVRKAIGEAKRGRLLLVSWSGIPLVPLSYAFFWGMFAVIAMIR